MAEQGDFNLERFISAQGPVFSEVLAELRAGRKRTHWIWFVFPQISGLGFSLTSRYYAICSVEEARAYLAHPILGQRLRKCVAILLAGEISSPMAIFGQPDTMKFQSCLTLFAGVSKAGSVFDQALDRFFKGERCEQTMVFLAQAK